MAFFDKLKNLIPAGRIDITKRYALLREASSGTMSKFYMARDLRSNQVVGLKILDIKKTADLEARYKEQRKPTEGEIAMLLKHPRIVETFEHGLTTQGAQFIVMEFLEGADMNSILVGKNPCLEGNRVHFIRQAAESLATVHAAGFIHRDICPRNFFVLKDGKNLKLIDFGLTVPATPPFMRPGIRTGNPNYMAPEIVRHRPIDQRIDTFAFGISAYEICTGELPWPKGATGLAAMSHDQHPPTDIRQHRPQIDIRLARAIHLCLESDPAKRCPSMEKFLDIIKAVRHEDEKPEAGKPRAGG